ncbi:hypothetical protein [Chromobacterium violaceum]|uniref:hypothetical protein n=1 Tax=Chromobacterium violaceum TaxID=536 RepID=UPI00143D2F0D|nr:hypothetical protein [Chromobacterium violaceum]QIY79289.1 hypothetical protein FOB43_08855 [Chromobacterium violaceum]
MTERLPNRVLIVGGSGAGKSMLATRLAAVSGVPLAELDAWFWGPGWTRREVFSVEVAALAAQPRWVAEGSYASALRTLLPRAELVVWLDYPRPLQAWRIVRRSLRRAWQRETLAHGNRETLRGALFSRDSLLLWMWRGHCKRRAELSALRAVCPASWQVFRAPAQTARWLNGLILPEGDGRHD